MTTLAIIGGGIAGRSLIYTLANQQNPYSTILWFESDSFAFPCSLHSTAVVARRGVSAGVSDLGDFISEGFKTFSEHAKFAGPAGVSTISQLTVSTEDKTSFLKRYPQAQLTQNILSWKLESPSLVDQEDAYLIHPESYLEWLISKSASLPLQKKNDFVVELIQVESKHQIHTQGGQTYIADQVILAGGVSNQLWSSLLPQSKLEKCKTAQGCYLEFHHDLSEKSFSLTIDGENLIYNSETKKLLIGSTTHDVIHELAPRLELQAIYENLRSKINCPLPDFSHGLILVGKREKAPKREPYIITDGSISAIGGFYKNGFSFGLDQAQRLLKTISS